MFKNSAKCNTARGRRVFTILFYMSPIVIVVVYLHYRYEIIKVFRLFLIQRYGTTEFYNCSSVMNEVIIPTASILSVGALLIVFVVTMLLLTTYFCKSDNLPIGLNIAQVIMIVSASISGLMVAAYDFYRVPIAVHHYGISVQAIQDIINGQSAPGTYVPLESVSSVSGILYVVGMDVLQQVHNMIAYKLVVSLMSFIDHEMRFFVALEAIWLLFASHLTKKSHASDIKALLDDSKELNQKILIVHNVLNEMKQDINALKKKNLTLNTQIVTLQKKASKQQGEIKRLKKRLKQGRH